MPDGQSVLRTPHTQVQASLSHLILCRYANRLCRGCASGVSFRWRGTRGWAAASHAANCSNPCSSAVGCICRHQHASRLGSCRNCFLIAHISDRGLVNGDGTRREAMSDKRDDSRQMDQDGSGSQFVGSIDQGTTSSRFMIFDSAGAVVASHQLQFPQLHPRPGWHEQDPWAILDSVTTCVDEATKKFVKLGHATSAIKAIGLTSQRETTLVWDLVKGEPLHNAIAWPDTRTTSIVRELKERPGASALQDICGLPLSTYPSAVKLTWLLRNVDAVRLAYDEGRLAFGTVDTWLLYRLNQRGDREVFITDVTNASRTMLLNLQTLDYDDVLLDFFQLDRAKIKLPRISPSADRHAFGAMAGGPLRGVPITSGLGDQSAALVGQGGFEPGVAKNTYGTGSFLLQNIGTKPATSQHGLLTTVAYQLGRDQSPVYALEGSVASAGSAVRFLSENLGFFDKPDEIEELASSVPDNGGVVFVTAFSGLFAPYWAADIKGTIYGITHHTHRGHIARATLEATCFQTKAIVDAMARDEGRQIHELAVDGGLSASDLCMQIQADILGIPVSRPAMQETTALGAALTAGLVVGVWERVDQLKQTNERGRVVFQPRMESHKRERLCRRWERAVAMARGWVDDDDDDDDDD